MNVISLSNRYFVDQRLIAIIGITIISLAFSFGAEMIFGYKPCKLCIFQRFFHSFIAFFSIIAAIFREKKTITWILVLLSFSGFLIASFHLIAQLGFISDPCGVATPKNIEDLKLILFAPSLPCSSIQISIFGIPLSGWNAFLFLICWGIAGHILIQFYSNGRVRPLKSLLSPLK